ncbi:hypothetical protein PAEPH01_1824 [Pancytospora epiphaga]|nr:hypothetical protein PAEPH01_1824 [Pancytospora epiphaga]
MYPSVRKHPFKVSAGIAIDSLNNHSIIPSFCFLSVLSFSSISQINTSGCILSSLSSTAFGIFVEYLFFGFLHTVAIFSSIRIPKPSLLRYNDKIRPICPTFSTLKNLLLLFIHSFFCLSFVKEYTILGNTCSSSLSCNKFLVLSSY